MNEQQLLQLVEEFRESLAKQIAETEPDPDDSMADEIDLLRAEIARHVAVVDRLNEWEAQLRATGGVGVFIAQELRNRIEGAGPPPTVSARRHAVDDLGVCEVWCNACRENRERGLNPDGSQP